MKTIISKSAEDTIKFAKEYAKRLSAPKIIILSGDLGAGKTTFSKGFAQGLGITETITSPTFTLLNEYENATPLYHFDMYRLSSADEAFALGFETYFNLSRLNGIVLAEWAENVEGLFKPPFTKITIEKMSDTERKIKIEEIS